MSSMTLDAFRALVENAPDAIVVSRNGIVLYANTSAAVLLGHEDVTGLVGKPMTFLDARAAEVMRRRIAQMAVTGERLVPREYPARRKDGVEIIAEIASTIIDLDGTPAVLAYARDVTERTRLRAQLAHADRLASLGMMAAGVAHEINNPLAFIMLAVDMLTKRLPPAEAPLVDQVRSGVDRIAAIVRDLRTFGRHEDEPMGAVDLAAAIDAAERLVAHELKPRAKLVKEYAELPAVVGVGRQLEQVFVNILLNAALAQGDRTDGRVTIRAQSDAEHVHVLVEDDGAGIPAEHLAVIFEPFFTTRSGSGGTGLGLSISRDIVVRAGGKLTARSVVGEGTTMELTLARAALGGTVEPDPGSATTSAASPGAPMRILVVDDEPLIARSLTTMLRHHGEVVSETDSKRALERLMSDPPFDAVVCDIMMPGLTGCDLHEKVAQSKPGLETRFVFISGGAYTSRVRDYLARIPNPQLSKPFKVATLVEALSRVRGR